MTTIAERFDFVVGVDTHAKTHTYSLVECRTGRSIATEVFPTSAAGMSRAIGWIRRRTAGCRVFAAVEGTSSYGARLTQRLYGDGFEVGEVKPPTKAAASRNGKSDAIDASAAARSVLGTDLELVILPRAAGDRAALRILLVARSMLDTQRTANKNALLPLLRILDLGLDARKSLTAEQLDTIAAWRPSKTREPSAEIARMEARRLAIAVIEGTRQLEANKELLRDFAERLAPTLQEISGIGPVTAAIILCAYSHPGRVRSEAAFAVLAGVAPQPASSGNTIRHRLSRSGDRQLNRAFDVIARVRMSNDANTRAFVERRRGEGKTNREIRRVLKRYICREVFRQLVAIMGHQTPRQIEQPTAAYSLTASADPSGSRI
ncbi:IS110 family transposase [Leifsonia sp. NPDC056665]|uniref:IS110 family transposase n=1 Tax=Leifsonia sp. NPDC056665 TaxID=3345901 RepID=UPI003689A8F0